jgi:hypothetical protein
MGSGPAAQRVQGGALTLSYPARLALGQRRVDSGRTCSIKEVGLVDRFFAGGGQRAEDEFLGAGFDLLGEAGEDGFGDAGGEVVIGVVRHGGRSVWATM